MAGQPWTWGPTTLVSAMTTFAAVLDRLLRSDAGRPLVTFYDHAGGERTELSVTTYANWVAKTASLLAEEYDLERGQTIRVDLPTHWLGPVLLGAAWSVGLVVSRTRSRRRRVRPRRPRPLGRAGRPRPGPGHRPAPPGDAVRRAPAPGRARPRASRCGRSPTRSSLPTHPARTTPPPTCRPTQSCGTRPPRGACSRDGDRVLTEENPASPSGLSSFTEPLVRGGSLVLVAHSDPERIASTYADERATARFP